MAEMLKIEDLHATAGEREILKGVNLTVDEGETCVLFGPNGSGKSTFAKHLNAVLLPGGGAVYVAGSPP